MTYPLDDTSLTGYVPPWTSTVEEDFYPWTWDQECPDCGCVLPQCLCKWEG
jgi:hypothetical protein